MTNNNLCVAPLPAPFKSTKENIKDFYERLWQYLLQIPCMKGQSWKIQTSRSWMSLYHPNYRKSICVNIAFSGRDVRAKALKVELYVPNNNDILWSRFCTWLNNNPNHLISLYTDPKNNQHTNKKGSSERILEKRPIGTYAVRPSPTPNSPEPILFNPNQIPTGDYFGHLNEIRLPLENAVGFVHANNDRRLVTWNKDTFNLTNSNDMRNCAEWFCETAQVFYAVMMQFK